MLIFQQMDTNAIESSGQSAMQRLLQDPEYIQAFKRMSAAKNEVSTKTVARQSILQ